MKNIKRIIRSLLFPFIIAMLASCDKSNTLLKEVYTYAGDNKGELELVLTHYKDEPEKLEAARFLLNNMFHSSPQNNGFEAYRDYIMTNNTPIDYNQVWATIQDSIRHGRHSLVLDAQSVSAAYLIENIDVAFESWKHSPWYNQIDFENFCNSILPYRVLDEPVSNWRKTLYQKYSCHIEGVECPKKAFAIIYRVILKEFKDKSHKCPYMPDVMMLDKMQEGVCSYRCVYLISVLRSLGIPAAYDMVNLWANYSQGGHSWVAYVGNAGTTATMLLTDSIPKENNHIDSSIFQLEVKYDSSKFKHTVDSLKKVSKIYRKSYKVKEDYNKRYDKASLSFFNDLFITDVSEFYNLRNEVTFKHSPRQELFLCTFASVRDWQVVAKGINNSSETKFTNIGGDIVYLPVYFSGDRMVPLENPFILYSNGTKKTISPDIARKERVVLRRKYLLFAHWINRWSKIVDASIDGSNDPDFNKHEQLYKFTEIPDGITQINIESKRYRYIRFQAPLDARPNIAEMRFYGINQQNETVQLAGDLICENIHKESALKAFDSNYSTYSQSSINHYWFGFDLGRKNNYTLNRVDFCMRHDMNMIEANDNYELFYYDFGWHSLGKQTATRDSLVYEQVPSQSLLWLRNHTKGREERIFTYENSKQIWW